MAGLLASSLGYSKLVEGAEDTASAGLKDMGVDHAGAGIRVARALLNGADTVASLEEVGRSRRP